MDFLTVITPEGASFRYDIVGKSVRIGRSTSNDVVLADPSVSRQHAKIVRSPDGYVVIDQETKNGTFVNERQIGKPAPIRRGDRIRIGKTILVFNILHANPLEFSERPLSPGPATVFLRASDIRTPPLNTLDPRHELATPGTDTQETFAAALATAEAARVRDHSVSDIVFAADRELLFHRSIDEILEKVMDLARRAVPYERGLLMLVVRDELVEKVRRAFPEQTGETFVVSRTVIDHVHRTKESILTSDAMEDARFRAGHSVRSEGIRSVLCVPLRSNDNLVGVIYADSRHDSGLFTERHLHLLAFLANIAAVKIENARLFKEALDVRLKDEKRFAEFQEAARIQKQFLPAESPAIPGYEAFADTIPCEEVGGDCYDFLELPGGRFGIGLGDVSGHGLPAALLMSTFMATLRAVAVCRDAPDRIVSRLNRLLCGCFPDNSYATFFYGILDPERHILTYVNAGHPPPLIVGAAGQSSSLSLKNLFVGSLPDVSFRVEKVAIRPGDVLVSYSDGILEAQSRSGRGFGNNKLLAAVKAARRQSAREISERIFSLVHNHVGDLPHLDDMTVVVLKRAAVPKQA